MKTSFIILFAGLSFQYMISQNVSAFIDYKGNLNMFDNGYTNEVDYLPVKSYKVGGNCIAYVDNRDNFRAFYAGAAVDLADMPPASYVATNDLVVYYSNRILSVFDNGKVTHLPGWASSTYAAGDSIIGYYDDNGGQYQVYYNGSVDPLPDALDNNSLTSFVAGDNILAYKAADGLFKAYYHGKVYDLGSNHVSKYKAGSSTIAYMDEYSQTFKVFYDGTITTLETLPPKSMQCGDELVAYVDASGAFKIFYKGTVNTISSSEQDFYSAVDNVVAFGTENIAFNVFYKGKVYNLESNLPINHKEDYNSVSYTDAYGYLKLFCDGQTNQVSEIKVTKFHLNKNVLMYNTGLNDNHFFMNGKEY